MEEVVTAFAVSVVCLVHFEYDGIRVLFSTAEPLSSPWACSGPRFLQVGRFLCLGLSVPPTRTSSSRTRLGFHAGLHAHFHLPVNEPLARAGDPARECKRREGVLWQPLPQLQKHHVDSSICNLAGRVRER